MTHHTAPNGRPYVECDDPVADPVTGDLARCARRTYGRRERLDTGPELSLFDLPTGWSVAPYPDGYDHGATRTSLLDGAPISPIATLAGCVGDLHTCPGCRQRIERGTGSGASGWRPSTVPTYPVPTPETQEARP